MDLTRTRTTVAELLRMNTAELTAAERKLMSVLFRNYPVAGLSSMGTVAREAGVSTPSVLRLAKKLGFSGFPAFQQALRAELTERLSDPIARRRQWSGGVPEAHVLNRMARAAMDNLAGTLKLLDHRTFDAVVRLLSNTSRCVFIGGGRITHALATYLHTHLQMARPGVSLLPASAAFWPQCLLDIGRGDTVVLFDVRRYDPAILDFAAKARHRDARIVLVTDQWISPVAGHATLTLPLRIEAPSSWDSNIVPLFVAEAVIAAVANTDWSRTQSRLRGLERLGTVNARRR